jgi:hypothetical protein
VNRRQGGRFKGDPEKKKKYGDEVKKLLAKKETYGKILKKYGDEEKCIVEALIDAFDIESVLGLLN